MSATALQGRSCCIPGRLLRHRRVLQDQISRKGASCLSRAALSRGVIPLAALGKIVPKILPSSFNQAIVT